MVRTRLQKEIKTLNIHLGELVGKIEKLIDIVIIALENIDITVHTTVKKLDTEIYHKTKEVEAKCVEILALQAPVAIDLRKIFTILEILTDLDRIGRYLYDISLDIQKFEKYGHFKKLKKLPDMAQLAKMMVNTAITSFMTENVELAKTLIVKDDKVDEIYEEIIADVLNYMYESKYNIERGVYYTLIARYFERISDHAVNIGDRVIYMKTGEKIIHL